MIKGKSILALVPARGGSKGIKDKNIYKVNGHPLIWYTLSEALKSKYIDRIIVSTDNRRIAEVAEKCGVSVPFLRPDYLSTDTAKSIDVVIHAIEWISKNEKPYDILLFLQPTSPLRIVEDIDGALEMFERHGEAGLASVSEVSDHPLLIRTIKDDRLSKLFDVNSSVRRQDMDKYYRINGSIYINLISEIQKDTSQNDNPISYIIPKDRALDIDEEVDLYTFKYYLACRDMIM